jgi:hypothetical protein
MLYLAGVRVLAHGGAPKLAQPSAASVETGVAGLLTDGALDWRTLRLVRSTRSAEHPGAGKPDSAHSNIEGKIQWRN